MDKESKNEVVAFTDLILAITNYYDFRTNAMSQDKEDDWKRGTKLQSSSPIPDEMHKMIEDMFIKYLGKFK